MDTRAIKSTSLFQFCSGVGADHCVYQLHESGYSAVRTQGKGGRLTEITGKQTERNSLAVFLGIIADDIGLVAAGDHPRDHFPAAFQSAGK